MQSRGGTMSTKLISPHPVMFLVLLLCLTCQLAYGKEAPGGPCIEAERQALLSFKRGLNFRENNTDPLPSWGSGDDKRDCCKWPGVGCSNHSGHVVSLAIDPGFTEPRDYDYQSVFKGKLSSSLFELRHLTSLSLRNVNFSGSQIPSSIVTLSHLRELTLFLTSFSGKIPVELGNLSELETLDLSRNNLHGPIPETFSKLTFLKKLCLWDNRLSGSISDIFWNKSDLSELRLSRNMLEGGFPRSIWNLSSLKALDVGSNKLGGHLPETMSQLSLLYSFSISDNLFQGELTDSHFTNLSNLRFLKMSSNSLSLKFHPNWTPPFRLYVISLASCKLGPHFPKWLQTQTGYTFLNISNCGISDSIPTWFWFFPDPTVRSIDISHNQIRGGIKNHNISLYGDCSIDLNSNQLHGSVPSFFTQFYYVNLFQNRFSKLNFSCNVTDSEVYLKFLDLSNNILSGELPDCWSQFKSLEALIFSNNNFSGRVPPSIGSLENLSSLNLNKNKFTGELPSSLKNCRKLIIIDVGENNFSGATPAWFGKSLTKLIILSLRFNSFNGDIPDSLCDLSELSVLDFSSNNMSGSIPKCINRLGAMRTNIDPHSLTLGFVGDGNIFNKDLERYKETLLLLWKRALEEFKSTLALVKIIDISGNTLSGEIPSEISELSQLVSLNLSRNNLSGEIPNEIGRMKSLDALDLSRNRLTGQIPQSLAEIDRLNTLDLSNNNLSGKIPTSTQLQSFEFAYWGNTKLCGDPLPNKCPNATFPNPEVPRGDSDELLNRGFYISMVIGFTTAFWGVCGVLIFIKPFRYAYFKLWNDVEDWVYVKTTIQRAKVMRVIRG